MKIVSILHEKEFFMQAISSAEDVASIETHGYCKSMLHFPSKNSAYAPLSLSHICEYTFKSPCPHIRPDGGRW